MSTETQQDMRAHWDERYRSGQTPWDTGITPPEVQAFWEEQPPPATGEFALDIGCGTGLNTLFLARQGLCAIGFDLSGRALQLAAQRLEASRSEHSSSAGRAFFVQADVSRLPVDRLGAMYALDIGCLHSLPDDLRPAYAEGVHLGLSDGGFFHLYVFDRNESDGPGAKGMYQGEVAALFDGKLSIVEEEVGVPSTTASRPSRWFLLRKDSSTPGRD